MSKADHVVDVVNPLSLNLAIFPSPSARCRSLPGALSPPISFRFPTNTVHDACTADPTDPYINHTRNGFAEAIAGAAATVASTAKRLAHPAPPLLITEFNCGLGQNCADHQFAGSFVAHQAVMAQATADAIPFQSYWTFSDIFEEQGQAPSEFSQAFGAQSIHGVPKPVYRAMQLLRRLHSEQVAATAVGAGASIVDCVVTRSATADGQAYAVEILLVNHPTGPVKLPYDGAVGDNNTVAVTLDLAGVKLSSQVELRRVDDAHSNALALYLSLGRPPYPNTTTLGSLLAASQTTVAVLKPRQRERASGFYLDVQLPPYSVASLSFSIGTL